MTAWWLSDSSNRAAIQTIIENSSLYETRTPESDYTNLAWPNTGYMIRLTTNYYDNYSIPGCMLIMIFIARIAS